MKSKRDIKKFVYRSTAHLEGVFSIGQGVGMGSVFGGIEHSIVLGLGVDHQ